MHPADIRAALAKKGVTQKKLIEGTPCKDRSIVSHVLHGRSRSAYIERRISSITGIPLHQLWPQFYTRDGQPKRNAA